MIGRGVDRGTKLAVLVSALAALAFEAYDVRRDIPAVSWISLTAVVAGYLLARFRPERTVGAIFAIGCLVPLLFLLTHGHFRQWYLAPWKCALVGASGAVWKREWQVPPRFRFALAAWGLAVACTWPIVALREMDWMPALLWTLQPTPSSPAAAAGAIVWFPQIAQVHLLAILWIDLLFGLFKRRLDLFERSIVVPLFGATLLAAALAVYQGFVDLRFLSIGTWADIGRASGALADGNASGALTAMWVAIPLGIAAAAASRRTAVLLLCASVFFMLSVWTTGSRTALLAALIGALAIVPIAVTTGGRRVRAALAAALIFGGLAIGIVAIGPTVVGPIRRARALLPNLSASAVRQAAWDLWARDGYGLIAVAAIEDEPLQGVGVGAFHQLSVEYAVSVTGGTVPADNAQNWIRHQIAELGFVGSIGCVWWTVLLALLVVRGRTPPPERTRGLAVKCALIGFGLASMLGMPGQNVLVGLTFATFAAWLMLMVDANGRPSADTPSTLNRTGLISLTLAIGLAVVVAATTMRAGWRELRPPFRAERFGAGYRYGFYRPFDGPSGETRTTAHALAVPQASRRWLKLTAWVEHPDADARPVLVQIWCDRERVLRTRLPRGLHVARYVSVPGAGRRYVIETKVDRTFAPPGSRVGEIGLNLTWEYVDAPGS